MIHYEINKYVIPQDESIIHLATILDFKVGNKGKGRHCEMLLHDVDKATNKQIDKALHKACEAFCKELLILIKEGK